MKRFQSHERSASEQAPSRAFSQKTLISSPTIAFIIVFGLAITSFHTFLFTAEMARLSHDPIHYQFLGTARQASSDSAWALVGRAVISDEDAMGHIGILPQQSPATDVGPASATGFLAFASSWWMPGKELSLLLLLGWMILLSASGVAILQSLRQRQWGWLFAMIGSFLICVLIGHLTSGTYTPDQTTSLAFTLILHPVMFSAGPLLFALFADPGAKSRQEEVSLHVSNTVQKQRDWEKIS